MDRIYESIIRVYAETESVIDTAHILGLSTVKVRRVLITENLWTSRRSEEIGYWHGQGKTTAWIAEHLNMTEKNVQAYLPYSKGMYKGSDRGKWAGYSEEYRRRLNEIQTRVIRRRADWQATEGWEEEKMAIAGSDKTEGRKEDGRMAESREILRLHLEMVNPWEAEDFPGKYWDGKNREEEIEENTRVLQKYGGVQYGTKITRDLLVPADIQLYALAYAIQYVFGWWNEHLHHFELPKEILNNITDGTADGWGNLVGLLLRSPLLRDDDRFWADDYEDGNYKNWLRKKYTGPYFNYCHGDGFWQCRKDLQEIAETGGSKWCLVWRIDDDGTEIAHEAWPVRTTPEEALKRRSFREVMGESVKKEIVSFGAIPLEVIRRAFETNPFMLLERLPVGEIMMPDGEEDRRYCKTHEDVMDLCGHEMELLKKGNIDEYNMQPLAPKVTDTLFFNYDYGDDWWVKITASRRFDDLIESGRLNENEIKQAEEKCRQDYRPVCIAWDGYNVVEDEGGMYGHIKFLRAINEDENEDNGQYEDKEGSLAWAKDLGWSRRKKQL